jgi:hypothetical protein
MRLKRPKSATPPVWLGWAEKLGLAGSGLGGGGGLGWITLKKKVPHLSNPHHGAKKCAPPGLFSLPWPSVEKFPLIIINFI